MGWSQPELAERLGRSVRYIQRIESEHIVPLAADRARLEEKLHILSIESEALRADATQQLTASFDMLNIMSTREKAEDLKEVEVYPQQVSWGPANGFPAGVHVWSVGDGSGLKEYFVAWEEIRKEVASLLIPWILHSPEGYELQTRNYAGKKDWLVWLLNPAAEWFCDVWFGGDPDRNWDFDGLVRFGDANSSPRSWVTFQRYSDGTYRKLHSLSDTLETIKTQLGGSERI